MDDNNSLLDSFITSTTSDKTNVEDEQSVTNNSLSDEFSQLLNSFINQESSTENNNKETQDQYNTQKTDSLSLDMFATQLNQSITEKTPSQETSEGLESSIDKQETNTEGLDDLVSPNQNIELENDEDLRLKDEERELHNAIQGFYDGMLTFASNRSISLPDFDYDKENLIPNYKPSIGKKIAQYLLDCWEILSKNEPEKMKKLPKNAGDDEYLEFAESLSEEDSCISIIVVSYVGILINLEFCEIKYQQRKELQQKNRIKKELYEEYMQLQERKNIFIKKLKEKNFPIDVDKLIGNYFRVAQKDAKGAFEALTKNPATFAPIQVEKIKPKFFGLIKVSPEDGIKMNQKIGEFIKKLKV